MNTATQSSLLLIDNVLKRFLQFFFNIFVNILHILTYRRHFYFLHFEENISITKNNLV